MAKHVPESVSALGVCNFSPRQLTELLVYCKNNHLPRPVVVQNECHPYLPAREVRAICRENGIVFQAYASLGAGSSFATGFHHHLHSCQAWSHSWTG